MCGFVAFYLVSKKYKKLFIVVLSLVIVAALLFIGFQAFIHTVYFEYDDIRGIGSWSDDEGYAECRSDDSYKRRTPYFELSALADCICRINRIITKTF